MADKHITPEASVIATHGEIDGMVMALIEHANDSVKEAQTTFHSSLKDIGLQQPLLVLSSCETYLVEHKKLDIEHRVILLNIMKDIVVERISEIPQLLAARLVRLGGQEMTTREEVVPEWQSAASALIVALGQSFGDTVLELCKLMLQPGVIPHYFSIRTIADFAAANVFIVVPALSELLGRCLPIMGMLRHDNLKWVFALAFSRFSEAILNYTANIERADDKSITSARFSQSMYSAFEMMFGSWINSKEPKLRLAVVEALGVMSQILELVKLEELLPKLIPTILAMFKKWGPESHAVTLGFCNLLDSATKEQNQMLDPYLEQIMVVLYPLLAQTPSFDNQKAIRNYNELLRCFERLCFAFSTRVINFIFQRLEMKDDAQRVGGLAALKHIVNACDEQMSDKKELLVTGLKPLLSEQNLLVRQALSQIIIAMANQDYLRLEGGEFLVKFLVEQCSITDTAAPPSTDSKRRKSSAVDVVTPVQVRSMNDHILFMAAKTIDCMQLVLWPYLLEFVVPAVYTEAITTVCSSTAILADALSEADSDSYDIDFEVEVNLPKPHEMLARFIVLAASPKHRDRGAAILKLLQAISVIIHEQVEDSWDDVIPKLLAKLESDDWDAAAWEDLMLKFLSKTLDVVNDEEWIEKVGVAFGQQYILYHESDLKSIVSRCIGVVCRKSTKRDFIEAHLDIVFMSVDHTSQIERDGCAKGFGFCASSHLDMVIEKLQLLAGREMVRKGTGFLGLMKDKSELDVARIKSTIMLTYGYVTLFAPPSLIASRIEVNILASINPHFTNIKDASVKENLIRCVKLIGTALHPSHLKSDEFIFARRGDLIEHMKDYMHAEPTSSITTDTRALAIDACMTLLLLEPKLSEADLFQLVDTASTCVMELPDIPESEVSTHSLLEKSHDSLKELLAVIVDKDTTSSCLNSIFKHFIKWITSSKSHQRKWALEVCSGLLKKFQESHARTFQLGVDQGPFEGLGQYMGYFVPRCSDPEVSVRQNALACVQTLLRIQEAHRGRDEPDRLVEAITKLQERCVKGEPQVLFSVVNDLGKVFAKKIEPAEVTSFIYPILEGLLDAQHDSADGCCVVVNSMFRIRGKELEEHVEDFIDALHAKLGAVTQERTQTGILRAVRTIATHHLNKAIHKLMSFELPYDNLVVQSWHTLCADDALAPLILSELLETLNTSQPYKATPRKNKHDEHEGLLPPMKAICALKELLDVEETEELVSQQYAQIIIPIMSRLCACPDLKYKGKNKPLEDAKDCFKSFITRSGSEFFNECLEDEDWDKLKTYSENTDTFTKIAGALCENKSEIIPTISTLLEHFTRRVYETDRIMATCLYAEFINQQCAGDVSLLNNMKNHLLSRMVDQSYVVRMLCIRGLGNVAAFPENVVRQHTTAVLSALMNGMDDRDDPMDEITLEAMKGLSKVFAKIEEDTIRSILINICLRIRPCFQKDKAEVRAAAFELFGVLVRFGDGPSKKPFLEQIDSNLVTLFLHLEDENDEVVNSVRVALVQVSTMLECDPLHELLKQELKPSRNVHYGNLMNSVSTLLLSDFKDSISLYIAGCLDAFRSNWGSIRAAAAVFVGFILGNAPHEMRRTFTKEHVCGELIRLLRDPTSNVKKSAAEAMALLYEY